jgi:hypothetical protein
MESRQGLMSLERIRTGLGTIWMLTALYIATDLQLTWKTGSIFVVLGLIPPVALFYLWNHPLPALPGRSHDPRL